MMWPYKHFSSLNYAFSLRSKEVEKKVLVAQKLKSYKYISVEWGFGSIQEGI